MMGILPQHVPSLGVLAAGWATVYEAIAEADIDMEAAKKELAAAQAKTSQGSDVEKAEAQIAVETLEALLK